MDDSTTTDTMTSEEALARIAEVMETLARESDGRMTKASMAKTKRVTTELQRRYGR